MKCFLVSSSVTFVPDNYESFVIGLSEDPRVQGLILIDNREFGVLAKALALLLTGAAPRLGFQLLRNFFGASTKRKRQAYVSQDKKFFLVDDINSEEVLDLIRRENVDLLFNARTRSFFKKKLLAAPTLGCINIHHGLLPEQRGLMCDFWAHMEKTPFGFSIHQMTSKLDDGPLLKVSEVKTDKTNYMNSIAQGARQEAMTAKEVLKEIEHSRKIQGTANAKSAQTVYRGNPGLLDFYKLRLRGTKI